MNDLTDLISKLKLQRLGADCAAGLCIASLPWPAQPAQALQMAGRDTTVLPIGRWHRSAACPRRLLMMADCDGAAPDALNLTPGQTAASPPAAAMECFARSDEPSFIWERHLLQLSFGEQRIGLAMGLRTGDDIHWWEACGLVSNENQGHCRVVEMAGAIPLHHNGRKELNEFADFEHPYLHRHNWLSGHIYARLHSNGVCEVYAHHINSRFVDDGLDLDNAVPVMGFYLGAAADKTVLTGAWTGESASFRVGAAEVDVTDCAALASPEQPGRMDVQDGFLVWQPYAGMQLYAGEPTRQRTGDPYVVRAEDKRIPRGMARTLRFSLSLNPERSPKIARYQAPAWWYGLCEEFRPSPLLPVRNEYDARIARQQDCVRACTVPDGFERGALPRHGKPKDPAQEKSEPSWEGELPYACFLAAWRSANWQDYDNAMQAAYHFTDTVIDHASRTVRMHGYPPPACNVPMARVQGTIAAYLETGDPYLLDAAESVVETTFRIHRNSWPRAAVGRDACFIRGAVLLYRYFANEHFRRIAYASIRDVCHVQRADGSFGDQGGGTGIHQWGAFITKPWMGLLATGGIIDYLELFPDEAELDGAVRRFADWMMSVRIMRNGHLTWPYKHSFDGKFIEYKPDGSEAPLPSPSGTHQDSIARLMGYMTRQTGNPDYLDAWAESVKRKEKAEGFDHSISCTFQFLPWLQSELWQARLGDDGVRIAPLHFGERTPLTATIETPDGPSKVSWLADGSVATSSQVAVCRERTLFSAG